MSFIIIAILAGAGATALLDLWNILLNRVSGLPLPNWAMVGRWFAHLPRGTLVHENGIASAEPVANELMLGWLAHYLIGIFFAVVTVMWWISDLAGAAADGLVGENHFALSWVPPMIVGWVTILCGWLILSPGMGNGIAAAKTPNPMRARLMNLAGHTVFGLGLWACGLIAARLLG